MIYRGISTAQKLFTEGNSLMNWSLNHLVINGRYVSYGIYNSVRVGRRLSLVDYGTSSQNQTEINAALSSRITPFFKIPDVIFLWEGTNDMYTNGLTGLQAYNNLVTYSTIVRNLGAKLVVATVIARDYSTDPADLMDRINDYNTLVRANQSSICDGLCDLALDSHFDTRADASNTTYYHADKLHIVQAGQDLVISMASTSILSVIDL